MKFYKDNKNNYYFWQIKSNNSTAIYSNYNHMFIFFYKNGCKNNVKNASYINKYSEKDFCLNGKYYGNESHFTKKSWRKFVKLQAFL